jgi:hypothetical protein
MFRPCFLFAGQHEDYHRPTDDADRIDYDGMTRVVSYAQDLLRELDRREQPFTFQRLPEAPNLGPGHRASLHTHRKNQKDRAFQAACSWHPTIHVQIHFGVHAPPCYN